MLKKLAIATLAVLFLAPSLILVGIGVVMNPALTATGACVVPGGTNLTVGDVPDELEVTTANGETFTLNRTQLTHAATIIETGSGIDGVTRDGLVIALMAALTESTLRMLSNTSSYPESADYPNDGDGSDNDSLGLFQMRPQSGWGTVAELMDPVYQAEAFFGGPTGPNHPSPRGLLDIPGWEEMDKGEAAQTNSANGAADGAKVAGAAVAGGGKSDDAGADAGKDGRSKGEADIAELDPTLRSKSASVRGEGDVAMDKVEVLEKRSVSGMSANADNVAKALVRDANGLNTQTTTETGDAAALKQAAPAERPNAAAMAPRTGQTLHTLRIQLNPESLGQVTAIMRLSDGELKVELKVQSAEAYRQLTDDSSAIAKALRQQGYGIDQITVQQTNAGSDKSGMNAQQGQTSSQQFQFREGMAQNSSGGSGNGGENRGRSTGGQNGGEVGHEVVSGNASSTGASDGVYL